MIDTWFDTRDRRNYDIRLPESWDSVNSIVGAGHRDANIPRRCLAGRRRRSRSMDHPQEIEETLKKNAGTPTCDNCGINVINIQQG
jgi:hypothetical protein